MSITSFLHRLCGCSVAALLSVAGSAVAQDTSQTNASPIVQEPDEAALEALFDGTWKTNLSADGRIPGAVVAVVKDKQIVFLKGYGVSDIDTKAAVDPVTTRVRIGSVSKVLSALTALSFVDDGSVDLDTDVNKYMKDVQVPATFPQPVTLRSLLSHLSGFDAGISGWMVDTNAQIHPDPADFQRRLIRLHPVGLVYGYDNRGVGLMGHLAGTLGGAGLADAMKRRLFEPVGMTRSTMGIPDEIRSEVGACHTVDAQGRLVKCRHQLMREDVQAAGDVASTGHDMARFMIALLNGGEIDGRRILSPGLFEKFMDPDQNRLHPLLYGMGFIIVEGSLAGRRTMGHTGGMNGFSTNMTLFPESKLGVFISVFTSYAGIPTDNDDVPYRIGLMKRAAALADLNQYHRMETAIAAVAEKFAAPAVPHSRLRAPDKRNEPLAILDGHYAMANSNVYPLMERMLIALADPAHLVVEVRGEEVTIGGQGPYREVEPYVLQKDDDPTRWVAIVRNGAVLLSNTGHTAASPWLKKENYVSGKLTVLPLFVAILLCLSAGVYAALRRAGSVRIVPAIACAAGAAALVGLWLEFQHFPTEYFRYGGSAFMYGWRALIHVGWVAALAVVAIGLYRYRGWARWRSPVGAIESGYLSLIVLSAAVLAILLPYWGLIGNFTH